MCMITSSAEEGSLQPCEAIWVPCLAFQQVAALESASSGRCCYAKKLQHYGFTPPCQDADCSTARDKCGGMLTAIQHHFDCRRVVNPILAMFFPSTFALVAVTGAVKLLSHYSACWSSLATVLALIRLVENPSGDEGQSCSGLDSGQAKVRHLGGLGVFHTWEWRWDQFP